MTWQAQLEDAIVAIPIEVTRGEIIRQVLRVMNMCDKEAIKRARK